MYKIYNEATGLLHKNKFKTYEEARQYVRKLIRFWDVNPRRSGQPVTTMTEAGYCIIHK